MRPSVQLLLLRLLKGPRYGVGGQRDYLMCSSVQSEECVYLSRHGSYSIIPHVVLMNGNTNRVK